jgi:TruD family tRNA pseudouridine synthase
MESERMRLKALELERIEKERGLHPELFPQKTWVDDNKTLELLGIHIPHKENFPAGFLKLRPSDFIVEEISVNGRQTTIYKESENFPDEEGDTIYATLVKCGLSTLEAVDELASILNVPKDKIQYAGIKDKDAITSQEISFRHIPKSLIENIKSPHFFLKDIRTGKGVITKGGLKGNRFTILLRFPTDTPQERFASSLNALEKIKNIGFYNFFYLQRFGNPRLNSYKWGISILKGNYEDAIKGYISDPGLRETPFFLNYRKLTISYFPDWNRILEELKTFPIIFMSEIKVVKHLVSHPGDFVGALRQIEDQVSLWVQAVASLLFNRKISSYLMAGIEPPKTLPFFMSPDKNDWLPYAEDLEDAGIFPPDFSPTRPFRTIMINHRDLHTTDKAEILGADITSEGLIISFALGKGEYATTFLSHFVDLLNGHVPESITDSIIDSKAILGEEPGQVTLDYFEQLNISKKIK